MTWVTVVGFSSFSNRCDYNSVEIHNRRLSSDHLHTSSSLYSTPNGNNNNPSQGDPLEAVRRMLESSWNTEQMGQVPANPQAGASEVSEAIMNAVDSRNVGVFYVDIILPSYDISQGEDVYDEVTAVEFCVALSECLEGKTQILVRDRKTLDVVEKIFKARERYAETTTIVDENEYDDDDNDEDDPDDPFGSGGGDDDDDDYDDDDDILLVQDDQQTLDESSVGTNPVSSEPKSEMDSFRQQLSLNWDYDVTASDNNDSSKGTNRADNSPASGSNQKKTKAKKAPPSTGKMYRLASLFGNAMFGMGGSDMADDVIQAVRLNAMAEEDEENIIILSPVGPDEMIAVRGLVTKYAEEKKIILVNSKLQPTPRELLSAETVYSILPLLARGKGPSTSPSNNGENNVPISPKVVVMRRYPRDWQIFIDVGDGFDLAETKTVTQANKRGLPSEWIANCVEKYLLSVKGRR